MSLDTTFHQDGFECPAALQSLQELIRWLSLRQSWEETIQLDTCDSVARNWGVFPHEEQVYVQVITGLNGQDLLTQFPGLAALPVMPGESVPASASIPCQGHAFFFGPFSNEYNNL